MNLHLSPSNVIKFFITLVICFNLIPQAQAGCSPHDHLCLSHGIGIATADHRENEETKLVISAQAMSTSHGADKTDFNNHAIVPRNEKNNPTFTALNVGESSKVSSWDTSDSTDITDREVFSNQYEVKINNDYGTATATHTGDLNGFESKNPNTSGCPDNPGDPSCEAIVITGAIPSGTYSQVAQMYNSHEDVSNPQADLVMGIKATGNVTLVSDTHLDSTTEKLLRGDTSGTDERKYSASLSGEGDQTAQFDYKVAYRQSNAHASGQVYDSLTNNFYGSRFADPQSYTSGLYSPEIMSRYNDWTNAYTNRIGITGSFDTTNYGTISPNSFTPAYKSHLAEQKRIHEDQQAQQQNTQNNEVAIGFCEKDTAKFPGNFIITEAKPKERDWGDVWNDMTFENFSKQVSSDFDGLKDITSYPKKAGDSVVFVAGGVVGFSERVINDVGEAGAGLIQAGLHPIDSSVNAYNNVKSGLGNAWNTVSNFDFDNAVSYFDNAVSYKNVQQSLQQANVALAEKTQGEPFKMGFFGVKGAYDTIPKPKGKHITKLIKKGKGNSSNNNNHNSNTNTENSNQKSFDNSKNKDTISDSNNGVYYDEKVGRYRDGKGRFASNPNKTEKQTVGNSDSNSLNENTNNSSANKKFDKKDNTNTIENSDCINCNRFTKSYGNENGEKLKEGGWVNPKTKKVEYIDPLDGNRKEFPSSATPSIDHILPRKKIEEVINKSNLTSKQKSELIKKYTEDPRNLMPMPKNLNSSKNDTIELGSQGWTEYKKLGIPISPKFKRFLENRQKNMLKNIYKDIKKYE